MLMSAVTGVFVMVAMMAATVTWWWLAKGTPEHRRIRTLGAAGSGMVIEGRGPGAHGEARRQHWPGCRGSLPKSPKDMTRLQRRLTRAGYPHFKAAVYYAAGRTAAADRAWACAVLIAFGVRPDSCPAALARGCGLLPAGVVASDARRPSGRRRFRTDCPMRSIC